MNLLYDQGLSYPLVCGEMKQIWLNNRDKRQKHQYSVKIPGKHGIVCDKIQVICASSGGKKQKTEKKSNLSLPDIPFPSQAIGVKNVNNKQNKMKQKTPSRKTSRGKYAPSPSDKTVFQNFKSQWNTLKLVLVSRQSHFLLQETKESSRSNRAGSDILSSLVEETPQIGLWISTVNVPHLNTSV